jgi:hypothetical protein
MKLRIYILFIGLFFFKTYIHSQKISPQSINSSGKKMSQSNGSITYTVGELVVLSQTSSQGTGLKSGFSAGATLTTLSIKEPDINIMDVSVFPNPTSSLLNIKINHTKVNNFVISITDLQGREIYKETYSNFSNTIGINMASFSKGNYMLSIKDKELQELGVYKIIKE